jgi:hypothetical protein
MPHNNPMISIEKYRFPDKAVITALHGTHAILSLPFGQIGLAVFTLQEKKESSIAKKIFVGQVVNVRKKFTDMGNGNEALLVDIADLQPHTERSSVSYNAADGSELMGVPKELNSDVLALLQTITQRRQPISTQLTTSADNFAVSSPTNKWRNKLDTLIIDPHEKVLLCEAQTGIPGLWSIDVSPNIVHLQSPVSPTKVKVSISVTRTAQEDIYETIENVMSALMLLSYAKTENIAIKVINRNIALKDMSINNKLQQMINAAQDDRLDTDASTASNCFAFFKKPTLTFADQIQQVVASIHMHNLESNSVSLIRHKLMQIKRDIDAEINRELAKNKSTNDVILLSPKASHRQSSYKH